MSRSKKLLPIFSFCIIYRIHHSWISREDHTSLLWIVLTIQQVAQCKAREQIAKVILCLLNKCLTICQEEDIFHMVMSHEYIYNRNSCSCLTTTCSHNKEHFSIFCINGITYSHNRFFLIVTIGDIIINLYMFKR